MDEAPQLLPGSLLRGLGFQPLQGSQHAILECILSSPAARRHGGGGGGKGGGGASGELSAIRRCGHLQGHPRLQQRPPRARSGLLSESACWCRALLRAVRIV